MQIDIYKLRKRGISFLNLSLKQKIEAKLANILLEKNSVKTMKNTFNKKLVSKLFDECKKQILNDIDGKYKTLLILKSFSLTKNSENTRILNANLEKILTNNYQIIITISKDNNLLLFSKSEIIKKVLEDIERIIDKNISNIIKGQNNE